MPLYEYQCEKCAKRFERIQKYSDPPIETCPSCGAPVKKLFSSPAIQFRGSGFYITDYPKKSAGDSSSSGKSDSSSSSEGKSSSTGDSASKGEGSSKGESSSKSDTSSTTAASSGDSKAKKD